jgi:ribosomal protein L7/L12
VKHCMKVYLGDQLLVEFVAEQAAPPSGLEVLAVAPYALCSVESTNDVNQVVTHKARLDKPAAPPVFTAFPSAPPAMATYSFEEIRSVLGAKKIQAIKEYRSRTGTGLKDAKDAIDALEAGIVKHIRPLIEHEVSKHDDQKFAQEHARVVALYVHLKDVRAALLQLVSMDDEGSKAAFFNKGGQGYEVLIRSAIALKKAEEEELWQST